MSKSSGLSQEYIDNIEKSLNVKITVDRAPWIRCLKEMERGQVDGVLNGSFKEDRLVYGAYPTTADGKVDPSKSTSVGSYYLYVLKTNQNIKWDGKSITGLQKPIMITLGYSIKKKLVDEFKVAVVEKNIPAAKQFELMLAGDVDGVAGQEFRTDHILKMDDFLSNKIVKLNPPLESKPYYLLLSHQLLKSNPQLANGIWDIIKVTRESQEFKDKMEKFMMSAN